MTIAIQDFRHNISCQLISAGVTQHAQIISTVSALEKFVYGLDSYATTEPEVKNAVGKGTASKKTEAAVEAQKAADESAEKVAEAESVATVEQAPVEETKVEDATTSFTKEEVQKALVGLGKVHGRAAIASILKQVGAANMSAVAEADYPKIIQLVEGFAA